MLNQKLPFEVGKTDNFFTKLNEWVGDVFYDILPDAGFELRDEQIYMAFQLEKAFKDKKVMFAEAGVGTGKTIVYLLYAICYARFVGKPAIIACADETLIEQLVKQEGDIAKIAKYLNVVIDSRLAKSPGQYVCLNKLDERIAASPSEKENKMFEQLPDFVHDTSGFQRFYHYGDRKEYPHFTDEEWRNVAWDHFQDCFACSKRHRCGQTLTRDYYRKASDIIICSHDFYMEHIWTAESRKREGQLPLLPDASSVVFDEGHLVEYAAQKALTYRVKERTLEDLLTRLLGNDLREEFAELVEEALENNAYFFDLLKENSNEVAGSSRMEISFTEVLLDQSKKLYQKIVDIGESLVFEGELHTINHYDLRIVEEHLDQMEYSLKLFLQTENVISWVEIDIDSYHLVIMPRTVQEVLSESVFSQKIPFIFSSATLSQNGDFTYLSNSLGVESYHSFSVASPFDYEEQMSIYLKGMTSSHTLEDKLAITLEQLGKTNGQALLLFNTEEELKQFKEAVTPVSKYKFLFEGDKEISDLVSTFQNDVESVLCAVHLWEGLDIPGPSLSNVVIWSLPFPPNDPVFQSKRKQVSDFLWEVEVPYMILRLRQGIGRLIRTSEDQGIITLFIPEKLDTKLLETIIEACPTSPQKI
ncbi:ATP-dependent DNA helicase [Bacillus salitolerans]|uniref:ATP-dependent DNA helicase n=1 Tax=Bacillus salitolerans TaxID=1437434 RepID=A0ABW4LTI3_9BACI